MDSGYTNTNTHHVFLILACLSLALPYAATSSDFSSLVYTKCANQTFPGSSAAYHQTLSVLYQQLLSDSTHSKFSKSAAGDAGLGISGLFQCRPELGNDDCRSCVGAIPATSDGRCGQAVAARVQLSGCYLRYEADGVVAHWQPEEDGGCECDDHEYELLYKKCGGEKDDSDDFKTAREEAFAEVERQLADGGGGRGFCEKEIKHVRVAAECEGDLRAHDCGQCVKEAAEIAEKKCGSCISGEVYMDKCFLRYSYHSEGSSSSSKNASAKIIALAVGGTAAFCILLAVLKSLKPCDQDDDDSSDC